MARVLKTDPGVGVFEIDDSSREAGIGQSSRSVEDGAANFTQTPTIGIDRGDLGRIICYSSSFLLGFALLVWMVFGGKDGHQAWGGRKMAPDFNVAAEQLAAKLGVQLLLNSAGSPVVIGAGHYATVYEIAHQQVLKVQQGPLPSEALLGANLPNFNRLTKIMKSAEITLESKGMFSGAVMRKDPGIPFWEDDTFSSPQTVLQLAADLAVALHAMHAKVQGHVVLHCDILPKNVLVYQYAGERAHASLIDYGLSVAGALEPGESPLSDIFWYNSEWGHCRGTDKNAQSMQEYRTGVRPYSAKAEWRELGFLLYAMAEFPGYQDLGPVDDRITRALSNGCKTECALKKVLQQAKKLQPPVSDLVKYLILNHDDIQDEVADVLRHPAFNHVQPHPTEVNNHIDTWIASPRFTTMFGRIQPPVIRQQVKAIIEWNQSVLVEGDEFPTLRIALGAPSLDDVDYWLLTPSPTGRVFICSYHGFCLMDGGDGAGAMVTSSKNKGEWEEWIVERATPTGSASLDMYYIWSYRHMCLSAGSDNLRLITRLSKSNREMWRVWDPKDPDHASTS